MVLLAGAASIRGQTGKPGTTIHQEVEINASPARIYEALLDANRFSVFTRDAAEIERQPGGLSEDLILPTLATCAFGQLQPG